MNNVTGFPPSPSPSMVVGGGNGLGGGGGYGGPPPPMQWMAQSFPPPLFTPPINFDPKVPPPPITMPPPNMNVPLPGWQPDALAGQPPPNQQAKEPEWGTFPEEQDMDVDDDDDGASRILVGGRVSVTQGGDGAGSMGGDEGEKEKEKERGEKEQRQRLLRMQALKSMIAKKQQANSTVDKPQPKDTLPSTSQPPASQTTNREKSSSSSSSLSTSSTTAAGNLQSKAAPTAISSDAQELDSFLSGVRKSIEASSQQSAHVASSSKNSVPAARSTSGLNTTVRPGLSYNNNMNSALVVHFDGSDEDDEEEGGNQQSAGQKHIVAAVGGASSAPARKKAKTEPTRRVVTTGLTNANAPGKLSLAQNAPPMPVRNSNALENKIALLKSKIQQKKGTSANKRSPSPFNTTVFGAGQGKPPAKPTNTAKSPVQGAGAHTEPGVGEVEGEEGSGIRALSLVSLQSARDEVEKKLTVVRKLIEENLREELSMQRELAQLEAVVKEQSRAVEQTQDLLNRELIRQSELLEL